MQTFDRNPYTAAPLILAIAKRTPGQKKHFDRHIQSYVLCFKLNIFIVFVAKYFEFWIVGDISRYSAYKLINSCKSDNGT